MQDLPSHGWKTFEMIKVSFLYLQTRVRRLQEARDLAEVTGCSEGVASSDFLLSAPFLNLDSVLGSCLHAQVLWNGPPALLSCCLKGQYSSLLKASLSMR